MNFSPCLAFTISPSIEGGYANDPADRGGATEHGVTQANYDDYRTKHGLPTQDVRLVTNAEVIDFYRTEFWSPICGDSLPQPVDMVMFDTAVNTGVHEAGLFLQRAANLSGDDVDGRIGPKTLAALFHAGTPQWLAHNILNQRQAFNEHLAVVRPDDEKFEHGWENRVDALRDKIGG